jgi:hypothetical protein
MLYREIMAVCSEIHTKHINTLCGQNVDILNVKLAVLIVTTVSEKVSPTHFTITLPPHTQTAVSIYLNNVPVTVRSLLGIFSSQVPLNVPHAHFTARRLQPLTLCQMVRTDPRPNTAVSADPITLPYPNVYSMDITPRPPALPNTVQRSLL